MNRVRRKENEAMRLSDFAANAGVKKELMQAMENRSVPHAIIIEGESGCGKKTLAGIIAQYAVCSSDAERPCGVCPHCIKAEKGIHPDIFIADGTQTGGLNIEAIRNIRSSAYIKPNEAGCKAYLLFNCDKMLMPAQNAFLKVLEEPPENVMFIMTVSSSASLLQTVRSRSRIISLYPPDVDEAVEVLKNKLPDRDENELYAAAKSCGGNIGQTIELLERGGEEEKKLAAEIMKAAALSAEYPLMLLTNQAVKNRAFAAGVLNGLSELSAECVRAVFGANDASDTAKELASRFSKRRLLKLQENIQRAKDVLNYNVNMNFYGTWLCAVLRMN